MKITPLVLAGIVSVSLSCVEAAAQASSPPPPATPPAQAARPAFPGQLSPEERQRQQELTREDHADMMAQLGIRKLRPGPSGSTAPNTPNPADYDTEKANPFPD